MAIFKILHEGDSIKSLKSTIKYNTDQKKDNDKKRLIGMYSNVGYCLNPDNPQEVQNLKNDFIDTVETNLLLNKAKRKQNKIYEHLTISFSEIDDKNKTQEELQSIALDMCKEYDQDFDNTPFLLFPQNDSGKLHFHIVRGFNNQEGKSQRQRQSGRKMGEAAQKIEKTHNLTLTGKNDKNNWFVIDGKRTYIPQKQKEKLVYVKNKKIENNRLTEKYNREYQKVEVEIITNKSKKKYYKNILDKKISNINDKIKTKEEEESQNKEYIKNLGWFSKAVLKKDKKPHQNILQIQKEIKDFKNKILEDEEKYKESNKPINKDNKELIEENNKIKTKNNAILQDNEKLNDFSSVETFRKTINDLYRQNQTSKEFIEKLNNQGITIQYMKRENGYGGITFASEDFALAGGKINSMLTFGKIKKNNPELFKLITGEEPLFSISNSSKNINQYDINIKELNKNYKQLKTKKGDTFIYYSKKDTEKYPYNYNLKINEDKTKITFGQKSNDYDLKIAYELAKNSGWKDASSESKDLILRSMKVAYKENKEDLFFFKTKKPSLTFNDFKEIVKDDEISNENLIKMIDNNIFIDKEKDKVRNFVLDKLEEQGHDKEQILKYLDRDFTLESALIGVENEKIKEEEQRLRNEEKAKIEAEKQAKIEAERRKQEQEERRQREREREEYEPEPEPYRSKNRPRYRPR